MAIKKYKPTTPGRRGMTVTDYSVLSKVAPERSLLEPMKKASGRNNTGRITVRHHGGGNRTKYRVIDFKRNKFDVPATVKTLEYDPNRSAHIALVQYEDGEKRYILAPEGLKVGDVIMAGPNADIKPVNIGKAGRKRHMGWRPTVRGSVMNPCDHPHGGGEGKSPVGRPGPVTPWGKPAMGYKTRKHHNRSDKFIVKRANG